MRLSISIALPWTREWRTVLYFHTAIWRWAVGACMATVGAHIARQQGEWLLGADFQMPPADLQGLGFLDRTGGCMLRPAVGEITCVTAGASSLIDYFVCSTALSHGVDKIYVQHRSPILVHRPVCLSFRPALHKLQYKALYRPPPMPLEAIVGPRRNPPGYGHASRAASHASRGGVCDQSLS